jgi:multidrug efflux pump subunit AcrB
MSRFAIRNPYFIIVLCLFVLVIGLTSLVRMPVDLFPPINIPEVVIATFYNGMPPEDIETEITGRFERFSHWAPALTTWNHAHFLGRV